MEKQKAEQKKTTEKKTQKYKDKQALEEKLKKKGVDAYKEGLKKDKNKKKKVLCKPWLHGAVCMSRALFAFFASCVSVILMILFGCFTTLRFTTLLMRHLTFCWFEPACLPMAMQLVRVVCVVLKIPRFES